MQQFLLDFADHYEPLKKWFTKNKLTRFPFGFVKDYPTRTGTYDSVLKMGRMDLINLDNFGYMFYTAHMIVWQAIEDGKIDCYDYQKIWQIGAFNFLASVVYSQDKRN